MSNTMMDVGRAITPGRPAMSTSTALILVGLAGMIFMCSALWYVSSSITSWWNGPVVEDESKPTYEWYAAGEAFPVITQSDGDECTRRRWQVVSISVGSQVIFECHPQ